MKLLDETIAKIGPVNAESRKKAKERLDQLTMPYWALGRVMDLAVDLAGITGSVKPKVAKKIIVVMAGDHGVVAEGVSKYPQEVTVQMVANFINGGAGINAVSRVCGAEVMVADLGVAGELPAFEKSKFFGHRVASGSANMAQGPAMSRDEAVKALENGISIALDLADFDLFGTGDMGIGNTTASSAIIGTVTGKSITAVTGRGTGIDEAQFDHKISIIEKAIKINNPDPNDGIDILSKVGGFEIGGIAGYILGAASMKKPIVLDGLISAAGALIAVKICPQVRDYLLAGHLSVEQGHKTALEYLGKEALLDLNMRLGEGTGAALAMNIVDAAVRVLTEVATFEEASVSKAE
jgi:nicotinate-nucleotide--dimethylbenzimidazole phosphoribosyltransferase